MSHKWLNQKQNHRSEDQVLVVSCTVSKSKSMWHRHDAMDKNVLENGEDYPYLDYRLPANMQASVSAQLWPIQRSKWMESRMTPVQLLTPTPLKDWILSCWLSASYITCAATANGPAAVAQSARNHAKDWFEALLKSSHPALLTALTFLITMLHLNDYDNVSTSLFQSLRVIAGHRLSRSDPVLYLIRFMILTVDRKTTEAEKTGFTHTRLRKRYQQVRLIHGDVHLYTLSAHTQYVWALRYDDKVIEAVQEGRTVYRTLLKSYGPMHCQTIISLCILATTLSCMEDGRQESIEAYRTALQAAEQTFGKSHLFTSECRRRLADQLMKVEGLSNGALSLFKSTLDIRTIVLGEGHAYTLGAREQYNQCLQKLKRPQVPRLTRTAKRFSRCKAWWIALAHFLQSYLRNS